VIEERGALKEVSIMQELYIRLAKHLEYLIMGYPYTDELIDLLVEMFSPTEAQVALAIPNDL
jgi:hypothetical protein